MAIFDSGFEVAGFPEWDTKDYGEQSSTYKVEGSYSLRSTAPALDFKKNFGGSNKLVYVRLYGRWEGLVSNVGDAHIIYIYGAAGDMFVISLHYHAGANVLYIYSDYLGIQYGTTPLVSGQFYCIEIRAQVSSSSTCWIKLNDVIEATLTGNNDQIQPLTTIELVDPRWGTDFTDRYIDALVADSSPIGPYVAPGGDEGVGARAVLPILLCKPFSRRFPELKLLRI